MDERDRRSQRLSPSAQGLALQQQLRQHGQGLSAQALHGGSATEAAEWQRRLNQVLTNLRQVVDTAQD